MSESARDGSVLGRVGTPRGKKKRATKRTLGHVQKRTGTVSWKLQTPSVNEGNQKGGGP